MKKKYEILDGIDLPKDVRALDEKELPQLCDEVRDFLIETVSKTGGHFGSNLGVVELTVALHRVFDTPKDKLVWDVGHQAYPHKILTGRKNKMHTLRKKGGIAPFPKREESEYDALGVGHSATSIGSALGMAVANKSKKNPPSIVAVIGDGALTGGQAFEALNHAGDIEADILVILNDNDMSISPNVGGLSKYLTRLISSPSYVSFSKKRDEALGKVPSVKEFLHRAEEYTRGMINHGTLFEELGFKYYGPVDGHDVGALVDVLSNLKKIKGPKFLHIVTKKGKGYKHAEKHKLSLHAVSPFDPKTGETVGGGKKSMTYTDVFSEWICDAAKNDERMHAITPAMCEGSGLSEFKEKFSNRWHDVGIAEQHAVTFAAGLSCEGMNPVVAIYSSFLQRAYDQVIHDIAIQNLNVLFAIDRAGIVGEDGATHNGSFDIAFLRCVPNFVIMTPSDENECYSMLEAGYAHDGPVAVRYPRGGSGKDCYDKNKVEKIEIGKASVVREGENIAILVFGSIMDRVQKTVKKLNATLVDMRFLKPLDGKLLKELSKNHKHFVTIEDGVVCGGAGSAVGEFVLKNNLDVKVKNLGHPDEFLTHGSRDEVLRDIGLCEDGIMKSIKKFISK